MMFPNDYGDRILSAEKMKYFQEVEKILVSLNKKLVFRKYFPSTANRIDELTKEES